MIQEFAEKDNVKYKFIVSNWKKVTSFYPTSKKKGNSFELMKFN